MENNNSARVNEGDLLSLLAGNLHVFNLDQLQPILNIEYIKVGTCSASQAAIRILSALQMKKFELRTQTPIVDVNFYISELKQLQTEVRVRQLSLQLSRTDSLLILVKCIVEAR